MNGIKVPLKEAQSTKEILRENNLLDNEKVIIKEKAHIFYPVNDFSRLKRILPECKPVQKNFKNKKRPKTLKDAIEKKLNAKEKGVLKKSFDVVGTIAILEVGKGLEKKEKLLAETLMRINPRIKTVLKKEGGHIGIFRQQKMKFLAGENKKETIHRENNVQLKLNVEAVYFSSRLSSERKRIAGLVKPNEKILVMFSGAGPYVCVIAKNTKAKEVVGIEINPEAHIYATGNLILNKIKNARLYLGDVKKIIPKLNEKFDRIVMPLPKSAGDFLDTAFEAAKKGTIIHFYDFLEEKDIPQKATEKIETACKRNNLKCKILSWAKCGQSAPRVYRVCMDFRTEN